MVELHPAPGDELGGLAPAHGEAGGHDGVQAQGAHRVVDGLDLDGGRLDLLQADTAHPEPGPARPGEVLQQVGGDLLKDNEVAHSLPHQDVPHLFPVQPRPQHGAQKVPVRQALPRLPGAVEGGEGALPELLLLPVGEEGANFSLGVGPAAGEEVPGMAGGGDEPSGGLLLGGGEEGGVGGDAPPGAVQLVPDPGEEQPLLGGLGDLGQDLGTGHGLTAFFRSCAGLPGRGTR